jgi:hypothetical protein
MTMTATKPAAENPSVETYGTPAMYKPQRAIATHIPAKSDAEPAVPIATPIASCTSSPPSRSWRNRLTMSNE